MLSLTLRFAFLVAFVASFVSQADAFPQFQKQFIVTYVEVEGSDFPELSKKESCYVCHQGKKVKNHYSRNAFGKALGEYLDKKDRKDKEKIVASLKKVAEESSDPSNAEAPTFGELIAEGKLPGGVLGRVDGR